MPAFLELEITSGPKIGQQLRIAEQKLTFGRTQRADVVLDWDSLASGLHFQIHFDGTSFQLVDLGSTNGTFVNGERIETSPLADGDQLQVGETTFAVHCLNDKSSADEASPSDGVAFNPFASLEGPSDTPPNTPASAAVVDTVRSGNSGNASLKGLRQIRLRVVSAIETDATFTVPYGESVTFGRTTQSEVCLGFDPMLSSKHFRVVCQATQCTIQDLDSANGTWFSGGRITTAELSHGDRFRTGRTEFLVEFEYAPQPAANSVRLPQAGPNSLPAIASPCAGGLMKWQGEAAQPSTMVELIERLLPLGKIYLLVDFSRLEVPIPESLEISSSSLFHWFPPETSLHSPQLLEVDSVPDWQAIIQQGWECDAIVVLLSQQDKDDLLAALREMVVCHASEPAQRRSIKGICWPSVLAALLENNSDPVVEQLFTVAEVAFMPSSLEPQGWLAFGPPENMQALSPVGFAIQQPAPQPT